jgi:glycosyltransferase involved in cell wall biosynthesis
VAPISGVDIRIFRPQTQSNFRQQYGLGGKTVLTFAGVFDERKGIPTLLEAFQKARAENSNLHLAMIGVGKLQKYIEDFVRDHQLEDKTTIISWLPNEELPGVLCASDIFVHPSEPYRGWEEQFGYSMAEASACGLPVIATRSGSIPELILDQQSGILIAPGHVEQLTDAILKLAADRPWRDSLGMRGRRHIEENYSHEVISERFHNFFNQL